MFGKESEKLRVFPKDSDNVYLFSQGEKLRLFPKDSDNVCLCSKGKWEGKKCVMV